MEHNIEVMEDTRFPLCVTLKDGEGNALTGDGFRVYGGAVCPGMGAVAFPVTRSGGDFVVMVPGLAVGRWPWRYQVFVVEQATGVEWLLCSGEVRPESRCADASGGVAAGSLTVTGVLDKQTLSLGVQLGESTASVAENARLAAAARAGADEAAARVAEAEARVGASEEVVLDAAEGAARAAERAEASKHGAEAAAGDAAADAHVAEGKAAEAEASREAAEAEAKLAGARAAEAEVSAKVAADAVSDALDAREGAQAARDVALLAREETLVANDEAAGSAAAAAADKSAAEQARTEAQAAQSTAAEQAAIATAAAAAAQAPESIAAQAARPATMVLVKDELMSILGDASLFDLDTDGQKIIVHTDRLEGEQLAEVEDMLGRFVPGFVEVERYNQSIDIPWQDWQPGLRQVDWVGADGNQKVATDLFLGSSSRVETLIKSYEDTTYKEFLSCSSASPNMYGFSQQYAKVWIQRYGSEGQIYSIHYNMPDSGTDISIEMEKGSTWLNGVKQSAVAKNPDAVFECTAPAFLFSNFNGAGSISCTIGYFRVLKNGVLVGNYIPAVDELGNGCLYDTVTHTAKYSTGKSGLIHPEQETEVATYSLRKPIMYAKLTEHGVRRLYHVPDGCELSKEEYAAAYGFKPLVELQQPEGGAWAPVWRETDEEIVLEWVEAEPPAEEQ